MNVVTGFLLVMAGFSFGFIIGGAGTWMRAVINNNPHHRADKFNYKISGPFGTGLLTKESWEEAKERFVRDNKYIS